MPRSSSYGEIDLDRFSDAILAHFDELHDTGGPTGCYRRGVGLRTDLYASLDVAIAHRIIGIDLRARFGEDERAAWVEHINNYADSAIAFAFREDRPLFRLPPIGWSALSVSSACCNALSRNA